MNWKFFLCAYVLKRDNRKEGIDLNATLANSDTSTAKNSSYCFNKQASLDENVDGKILQILDDLLNLFNGSGKASQGIKDVNECFENIHITSESRLTG